MEMVEVKTADLIGRALDYGVALVEGHPLCEECVYGDDALIIGTGRGDLEPFSPSTLWAEGGPLIEKYGVLISPRESMVHIHGGPNAGWRESGYWGATIFRKGQHRRRAHQHETLPLVAAMRCIVSWSLGDIVQVPKELMP